MAVPPVAAVTVPEIVPVPTVNVTPLLDTPPACTITGPVVAAEGTATMMLASPQVLGVAAVPLKVTEPLPCADPKCDPEIWTVVPVGPEAGERVAIDGAPKATFWVMVPPEFTGI